MKAGRINKSNFVKDMLIKKISTKVTKISKKMKKGKILDIRLNPGKSPFSSIANSPKTSYNAIPLDHARSNSKSLFKYALSKNNKDRTPHNIPVIKNFNRFSTQDLDRMSGHQSLNTD